jgi:prepilin peptidase CpaA
MSDWSFQFVAACVALSVFAGLLVTAAVGDVRRFIISNRLNLAIGAAFLALALPMGLGLGAFAAHLGVGVAAFLVCMTAFAFGVFGGGDAKLASAVALWLGPAGIAPFLVYTALSGGVLAIVLIMGRQIARRFGLPRGPRWIRRILRRRAGVPYGVALCAGALMAVPAAVWFPG